MQKKIKRQIILTSKTVEIQQCIQHETLACVVFVERRFSPGGILNPMFARFGFQSYSSHSPLTNDI